jgi:tRNA pseudouridine38-40 synthase
LRIAISLEYDGSGFCGWQSQGHGRTVQDALESALTSIAGHSVRVHAAGRTDSGVHALNQVAHFDSSAIRPLQAWVRGVNTHLPHSIAVRWAKPVTDDFHARFSAQSRSYRYVLLNRSERPGLNFGRVGWHHRPLDTERINTGLQYLLGEQDFSSFRASECQAASPVKVLHDAKSFRSGDFIYFEFRASGFLHHMVRNIIGAMIWVGCGQRNPDWIADLLADRNRSLAPPTFEPSGLYFLGAEYADYWQLPLQDRIITPLIVDTSPWQGPESRSAD